MAISVKPRTADYVAEITGVDLRQPLGADDRDAIVAASNHYAVLVFHDQHLSAAELAAFGAQFGALDTTLQTKLTHKIQNRLGLDAVSDISNLDADGKVAAADHWQTITTIGNRFWHSDGSYKHRPIRYSILNAVTAVEAGGQTEYADLRAAYDALDDATKAFVADKEGIFWSHNTRDMLRIDDPQSQRQTFTPVRWPLVRTHPGSGRKLLWCDSKVARITGLSVPEGRALAQELIEHIGQRERVYSHAWRSGDLVMYDNRAVLHRGRRFDHAERREMRRVEIDDDQVSLGEVDAETARSITEPPRLAR